MRNREGDVAVKDAVRRRDGGCVKCGMSNADHFAKFNRQMDVHRVFAGSEYREDVCQSVCHKCHGDLSRKVLSEDDIDQQLAKIGAQAKVKKSLKLPIPLRPHELEILNKAATLCGRTTVNMVTWLAMRYSEGLVQEYEDSRRERQFMFPGEGI